MTDDLKVPKQQHLSSREACDCEKASRPSRGVPGWGLLPCSPAPLLSCPPSRSALIFSARRLAGRQATGERRRRFLTPLPSTGFEGGAGGGRGGVAGGTGGREGGLLSSAFYRAPCFFLTSSHIARRRLRPPVVALATLRQIQSVCAQSRTKAHQRRRLPAESCGGRLPFPLVCSSRN